MRRLASIVIGATVLPVLGAAAADSSFSLTLPPSIDLALPGFSERGMAVSPPVIRRTAGDLATRAPPKCYYMRQLNRNLQKLKEKPELIQLADAEVSSTSANVDCLTRSLEPLTPGR
jgi:hypothetical protein